LDDGILQRSWHELNEFLRITSATETVVNTDTTYSSGSGLNLTGTTFSVTDAPKWTTARTLSLSGDASGSVSWDGSGNATLSVTVADNSHSHGRLYSETGTTSNYLALSASNELELFNSSNNVIDLYLNYSGGSTSLKGPAGATIWTSGNDGSGSGLDADLLDGVQGSSFLRSDVADSKSGSLNLTSGTALLVGGEFGHNAYNTNASSTIYLGGGNDRANYSIGTEMQNYGGNYTKLDLRWHTGIRFFTLPNYGGVRFFNDAAMNNKIFSIGETDGNVRVTNTIYANQFHGDGSNLTGIDAGAPAGSIIYHAGSSAPSGYIKANGASLSTSTYSALFSAIGYTYGGSGGSFNVPDLRGEFIRGWDDGRGVDSGRSFGSFQSDDFGSHSHTAYGGFSSSWFAVYARSGNWGNERFITSNSYSTTSTGAADTRPRNRAMLACIKT
jgi:microcystin-dependent protein